MITVIIQPPIIRRPTTTAIRLRTITGRPMIVRSYAPASAITTLTDRAFEPLRQMLLEHGDHYMHLADLKWYLEADQNLADLYAHGDEWARRVQRHWAMSHDSIVVPERHRR